MCLNPIKIESKSKFYTLDKLQGRVLYVPCCECVECLQNKQNELYSRAYFQCLECWSKGGYVYFDTLTYDEQSISRLGDFFNDLGISDLDIHGSILNKTCFNLEDIRGFLVNLRRQLDYHKSGINFKHFIVPEYGDTEPYVNNSGKLRIGTGRPHYHVLFYIYDNIDPIEFSEFVAKSWKHGLTDNFGSKQRRYIMNHVFYKKDDIDCRAVCSYVTGYLVKDISEVGLLLDGFKHIFYAISDNYFNIKLRDYNFNYDLTDDDIGILLRGGKKKYMKCLNKITLLSLDCERDKFKRFCDDIRSFLKSLRIKLKHLILPTSRYSQGFGLYMADYFGVDTLKENDCIKVPDKGRTWKFLPIPDYIKTKIFKDLCIDEFGQQYFEWNELGQEYLRLHIDSKIEYRVNYIKAILDESYLFRLGFRDSEVKSIIKNFNYFLGTHTIRDYVKYCYFWRGRVFDKDFIYGISPLDISDSDLYDIVFQDVHNFGLGSEYYEDILDSDSMDLIINSYIIDECFHSDFVGFDSVTKILEKVEKRISSDKQFVDIFKAEQNKFFKTILK